MRIKSILFAAALVAIGAAGAYLAGPAFDRWRAALPESHVHAAAPTGAPRYQCSMHPEIVSDEPGDCPICQMELTQVEESGAAATPPAAGPAAMPQYQCSMHPEIVSDEPGDCPICQMKLTQVEESGASSAAPSPERKPLFYRHPMRPEITSAQPAKDEMGMDYIPVYEEEASDAPTVAGRSGFTLPAERQQLIGVRRARVERRALDSAIRAVGRVAYDPALSQAIVEYREALTGRRRLGTGALEEAREGAAGLVRAAALRLRQLGLSETQVREIAATGGSPASLLLPGKSVWVYAQVYEYEMAAVRPGQPVTITTPAERGRTYEGRVVAVDSILDPATRTARVRILVATPDANLRPETFVHVTIHVPSAEVVAIPREAVLHGGARNIVFVVSGQGTFEPRAVSIGREAGGYVEILDGVSAGEEVVTSANFLIDSESRFRAALKAFAKPTPGAP